MSFIILLLSTSAHLREKEKEGCLRERKGWFFVLLFWFQGFFFFLSFKWQWSEGELQEAPLT